MDNTDKTDCTDRIDRTDNTDCIDNTTGVANIDEQAASGIISKYRKVKNFIRLARIWVAAHTRD